MPSISGYEKVVLATLLGMVILTFTVSWLFVIISILVVLIDAARVTREEDFHG